MQGTQLTASAAQYWNSFWHSEVGTWVAHKGLRIVVLVLFSILAARFIRYTAQRITRRLGVSQGDALVRSEATKHRQAVASVISWVAIAVVYIIVGLDIIGLLGLPIGSLVAPAAVLGAALGFGAQRVVQDLLSGFFIIVEKQYGFGDLVRLTVTGASTDSVGTVEDVTLRVTKLRNSDGEVYTIPNGQIVRSNNLSKDWARAVIDIPVPVSEDLNQVNKLLQDVTTEATKDEQLCDLLLDTPSLMGVESIEVDNVHVRMVARTLPGKQFEVGRRLRGMIVGKLRRAGIAGDAELRPTVDAVASRS
ncbi:mechanosensitive ion channel family protein [Mycolicibacterium sp. 120266]|uniref:mechanosensitive ion channel family protein n=1 Tax=Mycolicibacterium sp. 120266 TaxID=3090601 RepID=UPI00299D3C01|nr:mechanosensitive ion channel family protein [Mycolicibacterium sp. 120266]MDX1871979.1 mechanosensitive ion channel family protein [Mycolicibacterium sp. 120266]